LEVIWKLNWRKKFGIVFFGLQLRRYSFGKRLFDKIFRKGKIGLFKEASRRNFSEEFVTASLDKRRNRPKYNRNNLQRKDINQTD
jgi:hypothetical protein